MGSYNLYVLPISGGGFPVQLAELSLIYDAYKINKPLFEGVSDYSPDLVMGASGGNVAAYIGLAADWYYEGMVRIIENIDSQMFVKSWWPDNLDFIPTWVLTVFTGTLYRAGEGPENLFKTIFTKTRITETEILTLAFNKSKFAPQIFSNRSQETSNIPELSSRDTILYNLRPIEYLDGDISCLSKVCMASAAIPVVTQPQIINKCKYDDGGLSAASPLSLLSNEVRNIINENSKKLHLTYYASYNMDDTDDYQRFTQYGEGIRVSLACMIHSRTLQDRAAGVQLIERVGEKQSTFFTYPNATTELLALKIQQYKDYHYFLFMYPNKSPDVKINSFKPQDVINLVDNIRNNFNFDMWVIMDE